MNYSCIYAGVTDSNPTQGIDNCQHFSVASCCLVMVEALQQASPIAKQDIQINYQVWTNCCVQCVEVGGESGHC
jgi:hypothetical protein